MYPVYFSSLRGVKINFRICRGGQSLLLNFRGVMKKVKQNVIKMALNRPKTIILKGGGINQFFVDLCDILIL